MVLTVQHDETLKKLHSGKVGRPTAFTLDEILSVVNALQKLGDWGFGIGLEAVKLNVTNSLDHAGRRSLFKYASNPGDSDDFFERLVYTNLKTFSM